MKKLKDLINERTVTIAELSKACKMSPQTIMNISKGYNNPTLLTIKRICAYFGKNYKDYIGGDQ